MKLLKPLLVAVLAAASLVVATPAHAASGGYWMLTADGQIHAFGRAANLGQPDFNVDGHVQVTPTKTGEGYWVLHSSGVVEEFGDATDLTGFAPSLPWDEDYTSMAVTPTNKGAWLFTDKGRVFRFGDAEFYGDMSGTKLAGPVLDAVATPTGLGYYMVGSDGGVFTFGDAEFHGSMGAKRLNRPVMSMAADPDGHGYWLVASDGGIFAFSAPFYGSMGHVALNKPISGIVVSPTGFGYLMVAEDGGVFTFGDVPFYGSMGNRPPAHPVVAIAAIGDPLPTPVNEWRQVLGMQSGTGELDGPIFNLVAGQTARLNWSCTNNGGSYGSCHFRVINFDDGEWLSYGFADWGSGERVLHPETSGRYYVQSNEFGDRTTWAYTVDQEVCVAHCR